MFMQVHNEGLHQIGDEDFLREMGIGCDDTGLELTQLSEITANIHCEQVWKFYLSYYMQSALAVLLSLIGLS